MKEVYKDISGYEGRYQVSNLGNIKSLDGNGIDRKRRKGQILNPTLTKAGYLRVNLWGDNGKFKSCFVHRLVAEAFIPKRKGCNEINHINEDKTDNRTVNLEWCDTYYNNAYGTKAQRSASKLKKRAIIGVVIATSEVEHYESIAEASRVIGGYTGNIGKVLRGEKPTAYGRKWYYAVSE